MAVRVLNKKTGKYQDFETREEADKYISENYEDPNFYQGELPEVIVRTPEAQARVDNLTADRSTPAARYRRWDRQAMSNPANPYSAAAGLIGMNTSIAGLALPFAMSPIVTTGNVVGNIAGNYLGSRVSERLYSNPDKPIKLNVDTSITPRQILSYGTGLASGIGLGRFLKAGTELHTIAEGSETPIVEGSKLGSKVIKHSTIEPEVMATRTKDKGFLESKYLGKDEHGLYMYSQPRVYFPKNPKLAFRQIAQRIAKNGYYPSKIEGFDERHFFNIPKGEVITDLGEMGEEQVGWTLGNFLWPKAVIADGAVLSIPEFASITFKQGGTIRKFKNGK